MVYILGTGDAGKRCCGCDRGGSTPEALSPCGDARLPTLRCRTAGVGLNKDGFYEFAGYESTPPKVYLTSTLSGTLTSQSVTPSCSDCEAQVIYTWTGAAVYSSTAGLLSDTREGKIDAYLLDCSTLDSSVTFQAGDVALNDYYCFNNTFSSYIHTISGQGCCTTINSSGTATNTLSDEYTTAQLKSNIEALTVSFTGPFADDCEAFLILGNNELSITRQELQYKFDWPFSLTATRYSCYRIDWSEVFTPDSGSVVTTPRHYLWNGTDTETPVYSISAPTSYGTVVVTAISASCSCV